MNEQHVIGRPRRSFIILAAASCILLVVSGCSGFDSEEARELVAKVGSERIRKAAQSLRSYIEGEIPPGSWPQALRELSPEHILVGKDGVSIIKRRLFVQEEGVYVVFIDSREPTSVRGGDPSFLKIYDGIYWYMFTG